jgi:hypothetical protein
MPGPDQREPAVPPGSPGGGQLGGEVAAGGALLLGQLKAWHAEQAVQGAKAVQQAGPEENRLYRNGCNIMAECTW